MNHFAGRMLLVSLLLSVSPAWALGVGEPRLTSALNMPLVATLPLTGTGKLTADDVHAGLASAARFNEAGLSRTAQTDTLDFAVTGQPGDLQITITGRTALRDPVLDTVLDVSWPGGQLQRHVAFLPGLSLGDARPAQDFAPPPASRASSSPRPVTAQARKGEDLTAVAARLATTRNVTPARMQWALMQANPSLATFEAPLRDFGPLIIPSDNRMAPRAPAQANAETGLVTASTKTPMESVAAPEQVPASNVSSRLDRLEDRTAVLDDLTAWGAQLSEWQNRLQAVETRQTEASTALEALGVQLAKEQARLGERIDQLVYQQPSPASRNLSRPDTTRWITGDSLLVAGVAFLAVALSSLLLLRRRRNVRHREENIAEPSIQQSAFTADSATPAPMADALTVVSPPDMARDDDGADRAEEVTDNTVDSEPGPSVSTPSPTMPALEFTMAPTARKPGVPLEGEQQDIVDIFIAHGRLDAAREMLEGELAGSPGRPRTRLKLMEVLAALGLGEELEQHADVLASHGDDDIRQRAMALTGRDFRMGEPLARDELDGRLAEPSTTESPGTYSGSDTADIESPSWALEEVAFDGFDQDNGSLADAASDERLTRAHLLLEEDKADEAMALLFDVMDDGDPASRDAARHLLERYETN